MSKRLFKKGDEVTLVSGDYINQLKLWKNKKAIIDHDEKASNVYIYITSENDYHNSYPIRDLELTKTSKITKTNKNFIKKQNKKKDFITTYLIQSFIIITKDDMKQ